MKDKTKMETCHANPFHVKCNLCKGVFNSGQTIVTYLPESAWAEVYHLSCLKKLMQNRIHNSNKRVECYKKALLEINEFWENHKGEIIAGEL